MKKYLKILKKCPLFYGIEEEELLRLLSCLGAKVDSYDKKYTVFREGSQAKYLGIVLSGSVQIISIDYFGNRNIITEVYEAELFGEAFATADVAQIPVQIIANKPAEIMLIDMTHILHTCKNVCGFHQKLIFNIMRDLAEKAIFFHSKMEIISKRTTREKLLAYLADMAKRSGQKSFYIPFDRQELADFLGVDRSGLSVEIGKLKSEGIIEAQKNYFKLN
ncbi:MAG: Crp/Fnr family transcriptional regulator [Oscillospiraceae bacterium]|nr:Crp/Fnr family transcriptional regulator [Oscillospiraceae bacterium]